MKLDDLALEPDLQHSKDQLLIKEGGEKGGKGEDAKESVFSGRTRGKMTATE